MAQFQPQKIDLSQINSGQRYGNEGISPEAINRPIEASAYAVEATEALTQNPDISEISGTGTPSVEMVDTVFNGRTYKKFKLSNFGSFGSRPNLLINSFFNVNQRGIVADEYNHTFLADRWYKTIYNQARVEIWNNGKCQIKALQDIPNNIGIISQTIECPTSLIGKTITGSVYIDAIDSANDNSMVCAIDAWNDEGIWLAGGIMLGNLGKREASMVVPSGTTKIRFGVATYNNVKAGDTLLFSQPKIELGTFSTPLSAIPYDEELIMCQRYYQVIYGISKAIGPSQFYTVRHQYYIPMRAAPTLTVFASNLPNEINKLLDLENNELVPVENFFAYQNKFGFAPICDTYSLVKDHNYGYTVICDAEIY